MKLKRGKAKISTLSVVTSVYTCIWSMACTQWQDGNYPVEMINGKEGCEESCGCCHLLQLDGVSRMNGGWEHGLDWGREIWHFLPTVRAGDLLRQHSFPPVCWFVCSLSRPVERVRYMWDITLVTMGLEWVSCDCRNFSLRQGGMGCSKEKV